MAGRSPNEGSKDRPKDNRSRIYWTKPADRERVRKVAAEHGLHETDFLETLVLAWFDPFHFSRMLRWLYPEGHPAFEAPAPRGSASSSATLEAEVEELRGELDNARRERDEAVGRASALDSELQKSRVAEREAIARLAALTEAGGHLAQGVVEENSGIVVSEKPAVVGLVERLLRERRGTRAGRHFESEVTEAAIMEEARREGLNKTQAYAQLRIAEASGQLRRIGNRYYLQNAPGARA